MSALFNGIKVGDRVPSLGRKDAFYYVVAIDPKRITLERGDTGSQVKITASKCQKVQDRIDAGDPVNFQGNAPKSGFGGIDGTSAIRDGICYVLGLAKDGKLVRQFRAKSAQQGVA